MQPNINLLERKPAIQPQIVYGVLALVLVLILSGLFFYFYVSMQQEIAYQQTLNTNLKSADRLETEMNTNDQMQQMQKDFAAKSQNVKYLEELQVSHVELIEVMNEALPIGMLLVRVNINLPKVVVNGFCADYSCEGRFVDNLKSNAYFQKVTVLSSDMNEETGEVKFTLEMEWGDKKP